MKTNYFSVFKTVFKSKAYLFFTLVFLSTSVLISCSGDDEDVKVEDPFFEIVGSPSELLATSSGLKKSYEIKSNRPWKIVAKESGDWAKASPLEGKNNGTFEITVQENKTFEKRIMNFAFQVEGKEQPGKIRVEQEGLKPFLNVSDTENGLTVSKDGGKVSITMEGNVEWTYTLDDKTWLTESKKTNSQLEFTAVPNTGATVRKATATITSTSLPGFTAKVVITQGSGAFLNVPAAENGLSVISNGAKVAIAVQGNVEWTYTLDDKTWLTESKKTATELELTATANLGWEERKATATITSASLPGFSAKVLITQASGAFLTVPAAESGILVNFDGGLVSIGVESNMKWKYTIDDKTWLTEKSKSDSKLELTATTNTGQTERKTTVTITSEVLPAFSKKVVITQKPGDFLIVPAVNDGVLVVSEGGKLSIAVQGNVDWTYTLDDKTWLTESKKTATELEFTAKPNLEVPVRTATVTITSASLPGFSAKVLITQASGASLVVPAANTGLSIISGGGKALIGVQANVDWTYTLDDKTWLTESIKNATQLELTATANVGPERKATVTITSVSIPGLSLKVVITQTSGLAPGTSPKADMLDVVFNLDGTATDVSPMKHAVLKKDFDNPFTVAYNNSYKRNMVTFKPASNGVSPGADKGSYYRVDYSTDSEFQQKLKDGHSFETLVKFDVDYAVEQKYETKFFSTQEQGGTGFLVANWNQATGENGLTFLPNVATTDGGASRWIWANSKIKPNGVKWYHLVGVWDKDLGKAFLYVNGELKSETEAAGFYRPIALAEPWVAIGGDAGNNQVQGLFKGSLAIARIYDKALTAAEAQSLWNEVKTNVGSGNGDAPGMGHEFF